MDRRERKKDGSIMQNVSIPRLLLTLLWMTLMVIDGYFVSVLDNRRLRGILFAVLIVLTVLFVRSFKKLMSDRLQQAIERQLGRRGGYVSDYPCLPSSSRRRYPYLC